MIAWADVAAALDEVGEPMATDAYVGADSRLVVHVPSAGAACQFAAALTTRLIQGPGYHSIADAGQAAVDIFAQADQDWVPGPGGEPPHLVLTFNNLGVTDAPGACLCNPEWRADCPVHGTDRAKGAYR